MDRKVQSSSPDSDYEDAIEHSQSSEDPDTPSTCHSSTTFVSCGDPAEESEHLESRKVGGRKDDRDQHVKAGDAYRHADSDSEIPHPHSRHDDYSRHEKYAHEDRHKQSSYVDKESRDKKRPYHTREESERYSEKYSHDGNTPRTKDKPTFGYSSEDTKGYFHKPSDNVATSWNYQGHSLDGNPKESRGSDIFSRASGVQNVDKSISMTESQPSKAIGTKHFSSDRVLPTCRDGKSDEADPKMLAFENEIRQCLVEYRKILIVDIHRVRRSQKDALREALKGDSVLLTGRKEVMRRIIDEHSMTTNNLALRKLTSLLQGDVGCIFTNDVDQVREMVEHNFPAPARAGMNAPTNAIVSAGNTGLDPAEMPFFEELNIPTRISGEGKVEVITQVVLIKKGSEVQPSEAALLQKLDSLPFTTSLVVKAVYDDGSVIPQELLPPIAPGAAAASAFGHPPTTAAFGHPPTTSAFRHAPFAPPTAATFGRLLMARLSAAAAIRHPLIARPPAAAAPGTLELVPPIAPNRTEEEGLVAPMTVAGSTVLYDDVQHHLWSMSSVVIINLSKADAIQAHKIKQLVMGHELARIYFQPDAEIVLRRHAAFHGEPDISSVLPLIQGEDHGMLFLCNFALERLMQGLAQWDPNELLTLYIEHFAVFVGANVAPFDMVVRAGDTGLDQSDSQLFKKFNIPTKLNEKGTLEVVAGEDGLVVARKMELLEHFLSMLLRKLGDPFNTDAEVLAAFDSDKCSWVVSPCWNDTRGAWC